MKEKKKEKKTVLEVTWNAYKETMQHGSVSQAELDRQKVAFYAGIGATLLLVENISTRLPETVALRILKEIETECADYLNKCFDPRRN